MVLVQQEPKAIKIGTTDIKRVTIRPNGTEKQIRPPYRTLTCYIDESKSDPAQMVTYGSDVTFTAGSSDRDNFFGYYPCLLNTSGVETAKLDPNNYAQDINGNSVNITNGDNVMVCFPRLGLKMSKSGSIVTLQITDNPDDPSFDYYAHQRGSTNKDKFYMGAYLGYNNSSVLKSWSGRYPSANISNNNGRTYSRANGTGYDMAAFYQVTFLQALYLFKYKNTNSQSTIGAGYTGGSSMQQTGATNTNGLNYGSSSTTSRMKLFGVEDFRGNAFQRVEGLYGAKSGSNFNVYISTDNFNLQQTNYTYTYTSPTVPGDTYLKNVKGTSEFGFLAETASSGSATTYYTDVFIIQTGPGIPFRGGNASWGARSGIFDLYANDATGSYNDIVARLMYL